MSSIKSLTSANFVFILGNVIDSAAGTTTMTVKPTTAEGKALFRFKKWGKEQADYTCSELIFSTVAAYEAKVAALSDI